jgi:menaquinone-dependent protoporphyrinogen oxidase
MGRWLDSAKEFVHRFAPALAEHPVWLFSSGPVGKPGSKLTQSMDQDPLDIPAMVKATDAREHRMFAGKLDRRGFSLARRVSLLVFRSLNGDFRDWADIRQWTESVALQLPAILRADRTERRQGMPGNGSM